MRDFCVCRPVRARAACVCMCVRDCVCVCVRARVHVQARASEGGMAAFCPETERQWALRKHCLRTLGVCVCACV